MKIQPKVSKHEPDPELVGNNESSSWVVGRNCVYHDQNTTSYRVSIKTTSGWKSYGHFNDLETATYVANIAILAEGCEKKYELNRNIGQKNINELAHWRSQHHNTELEKLARDRFEKLKPDLESLPQKSPDAGNWNNGSRHQRRTEWENQVQAMRDMSDSDLNTLIISTTIYDPIHSIAKHEAKRRLKS